MPPQNTRLRPCGRLDFLCQSALEKCLLRAFFVLGKRERVLVRSSSICSIHSNRVVSHLCEKSHVAPLEQIQSYLSPKLPASYRQKIVDNLVTALATPEFDDRTISSCTADDYHKLFSDIELKFKALEVIAGSKDMSEIIHNFLKCMLLSYVTKLDLSDIYSVGSCWVARSRRILLTWEKVKGTGFGCLSRIRQSEIDTFCIESYWRDLLHDHINAVSAGVLQTTPYFRQMVNINVDHLATGPLIWAIGCHCPNLQELSLYVDTTDRCRYTTFFEYDLVLGLTALYGHKKFTKTPFQGRPIGCPKIQRIVMPSVEIQRELEIAAAKLLCHNPHLMELANIGTPGPFAMLLQDREFRHKALSLTHIDEGRTGDHMEEVCDYFNVDIKFFFPNVTNVRLLHAKYDGGIKMLSNFPKLKYLEVVSEDGTELEFGPYFTNLTHVRSNCRWDEKKLAGFSQRAPNLEAFFVLGGSLCKHKKARESMSFPKMRLIKLLSPVQCDSEPLISLIKSSKFLTHILLEHEDANRIGKQTMLDIITDKLIATIVPSLKKLKCFHLRVKSSRDGYHYPVTEKGFNAIVHGCPDLTEIGNLFHWNIPYKRVIELKKKVRESNWDVDIFPLDNI